MVEKVLSKWINGVDFLGVSEIRIRENLPIMTIKNGQISSCKILANKNMIEGILKEVTFSSFYAFEEQFRRGFITFDGAKIAIAGEGVYEKGELCSIKNVTSLAIRFPKSVKGVAKLGYEKCVKEGLCSTLIIGKTCCGKTTYLRDLIAYVKNLNVVVIDERAELDLGENSLGGNVDVLKNIRKVEGAEFCVRGLNADLICVDELCEISECNALIRAKRAGAEIFATFHGASVSDYLNSPLFINGLFTRFITLKNIKGKAETDKVYDENCREI